MPQSLAKVWIHLVFSTKDRFAHLDTPEIQMQLHQYLGGICGQLKCPALNVGGTQDHVHVLFKLSKNVALKDVVESIKKGSSKWCKTLPQGRFMDKFYWQRGYGAFSVSQSDVQKVETYIANQEMHHRRMSFKDEFLRLLNRYDVQYDDRYLWD